MKETIAYWRRWLAAGAFRTTRGAPPSAALTSRAYVRADGGDGRRGDDLLPGDPAG